MRLLCVGRELTANLPVVGPAALTALNDRNEAGAVVTGGGPIGRC